ncbi:hypothetical protein V6N13_074662 [Hibiscus sabdariffa]
MSHSEMFPISTSISSLIAAENVVTCMDGGKDDVAPEEVTDDAGGLNDMFVVDDLGRVHVAKSVLLGNEEDVFGLGVSNEIDAAVNVALTFDMIDDWLAANDESGASVQCEPIAKIHAKKSSGAFDLSKLKEARPTITSSLPKDLHKIFDVGNNLKTWQAQRRVHSVGRIRYL